MTVLHADTLRTPDFVRPGSVDVVVTDAPYGVQHASRAGASGRTARSPVALLEQALPVWRRLLRPGGAVGIAWNTLVAPRAELVHLLGRPRVCNRSTRAPTATSRTGSTPRSCVTSSSAGCRSSASTAQPLCQRPKTTPSSSSGLPAVQPPVEQPVLVDPPGRPAAL